MPMACSPALRRCLLPGIFVLFTISSIPSELSGAPRPPAYIRALDQKPLPADEVLADLVQARIIIFGETHGSRSHHETQIVLLRHLIGEGASLVLAMEAFPESVNPDLERWSDGTMDSAELFTRFGETWTFDWWPVYRDLLFFVREKGIPLVGINADEKLVRRVARVGIDGLGEKTRNLLPEVTCTADTRYLELLGMAMNGGSASDSTFAKFCEAQVLRDAVMARASLAALRRWPDRIVVVLTGNFHAWKHGIASHLPKDEDLPVKVILPGNDVPFPDGETLAQEADYIWFPEP
jgi:uncharacterized iron-regulated protein